MTREQAAAYKGVAQELERSNQGCQENQESQEETRKWTRSREEGRLRQPEC